MHSTASTALAGFALLSSTTSALCTDFELHDWSFDDGRSVAVHDGILVDTKLCPADSKTNCMFNQKSYSITAERILGDRLDPMVLPKDEADAIFQLAQDAVNNYLVNNHVKSPKWEFKTIDATVSLGWLPSSFVFDVKPGNNASLFWIVWYGRSSGVLGGCTNETLNNMTVTAATPYLRMDPKLGNRTVLAGSWYSGATAIDDEESAASLLKGGATVAWVIAMVVLMCIL